MRIYYIGLLKIRFAEISIMYIHVILLGLQIMTICFEKQLANEWYNISRCVQDIGNKLLGKIYFSIHIDSYRIVLIIELYYLFYF